MLASRKELVEYDRQQQEAAQSAAVPLSASSTPSTPTLCPRASELFVTAADVKPGTTRQREKLVYSLEYLVRYTYYIFSFLPVFAKSSLFEVLLSYAVSG